MRMGRRGRFAVAGWMLCVVLATGGGCVRTQVRRVARFAPSAPDEGIERRAPVSAVYRVMYAGGGRPGLHRLPGSGRIVARGEAIGFSRREDGRLVAVAGEERVPLDKLPPSARYCVWLAEVKRQTEFGKVVAKATNAAAKTATVAAGVGAGAVGSYLENEEAADEQRREDGACAGERGGGAAYNPKHHGHRHHGHWHRGK
jgi:hypothetical protein